MRRLSRRLHGVPPFDGDIRPSRIPLYDPGSGRPSAPFPHPWNYKKPIGILETFFHGAETATGSARHNRYLDVPGFAPVLVTRDPGLIKAILSDTGDKPGQFDRDTMPSVGIARATGADTLLYANGETWRRQRKLTAMPFSKTRLFHPERFHEFEETFRQTATQRVGALRDHLAATGKTRFRTKLEPEIKTVMLEMLANNFFGAGIPCNQIRDRFVPALERIIDRIVRDTVLNQLGLRPGRLPAFTKGQIQARDDRAAFEELTDRVIAPRHTGRGLWEQFKSDAPDDLLRSNVRVFLAGALEATTSFACWALSHLARHPEVQERVFEEVKNIDLYTPDNLDQSRGLNHVLEETLRLTPSLYFLPRRATKDTWVETDDARRLFLPAGTHVLLDVWHANRLEEIWGVPATGYPADAFDPRRWERLEADGFGPKDFMHFGFGHGARVCPGKFLGQLEVGLVVGALVRTFRLRAVESEVQVQAGVSTKPADGVWVDLELRNPTRSEPRGPKG